MGPLEACGSSAMAHLLYVLALAKTLSVCFSFLICHCFFTQQQKVSPPFLQFSLLFGVPSLSLTPGKQHSGSASADPLYPRAGSGCSGAPGGFGSGPRGIPQQEGGGPVCPGLREARPAGARGPDGLHTGAAQGD